MTQLWPPSPCVEDEEVALAKEHGLDIRQHRLKSEDQPASTRGSVDQYPIILDGHDGDVSNSSLPATDKHHRQASTGGASKDHEDSTIPSIVKNNETRFIYIPSETTEPDIISVPETLHRSKSATQLEGSDMMRGRPQITRIHTDFGPALEGMVTGHRRAPSPYTYDSSSLVGSLSAVAQPGTGLLSPMHAIDARRSASMHPESHGRAHISSDSDRMSKPTKRHDQSRSRARRQSSSHLERVEFDRTDGTKPHRREHSPERFSRRAHRHRSPAPSQGGFVGYSYTSREHITPPQSPHPALDATRASVVDQTAMSGSSSSRNAAKRGMTDSPYTSSAEEGQSRWLRTGDRKSGRSRRSSHSFAEKDDKPRPKRDVSHSRMGSKDGPDRGLEPPGERSRREPQTRSSSRTTKAMEDYFEKAFLANQNKRPHHGDLPSRAVSPLTSPPQSPPRTPRGQRTPREYFEPPANSSKSSKPRSRPPSIDDNHFKDFKPLTSLLGAATMGASLAAKAIPSLSRSTTSVSTIDTPSSGFQSRPTSGQRSRKPSPVSEESLAAPHDLSRSNSMPAKDDSKSVRTTTYSIHEDRILPKPSIYIPAPVELPRTALRAASYSSSPEQPRPTVPYRAFSSTSTPIIQQTPPVPAHPSTQPNQGVADHAPSRPNGLPACPRSRPMSGLHDWYTIRDMSFLDFCPTCMSFLGATRFRDHFLPSLPKDPRRPVVCALSLPWLRIAWIQSVKQDKKDLTLVWHLSVPPPQETRPCAGSSPDLRRWYHLTDSRTRRPVDNFDICSACVRNIDLIFPPLKFHLFDRPANKNSQEKVCNLNTSSRHFLPIMMELERLAERRQKEQLRQKDIQDFVDFVRRTSRHRECVKDAMLATASWHFIPDLPELSICEECFEDVVWPLRDRPIAKEVSKAMKLVPNLRKSHLVPGTSCQLYSERMRRSFREAVSKNDFEGLKTAAKHRYSMEHRLQEMHKLYEMDQQAGIDRRAEMEKNISIWRSIE